MQSCLMIRWWRLEKVHRGLMTRSWGQPTSRGTLGVFCASVAAAAIFTVFRSFPSSDLSRHCRIYPNDGRTDGRTTASNRPWRRRRRRKTDRSCSSVGRTSHLLLPPSLPLSLSSVYIQSRLSVACPSPSVRLLSQASVPRSKGARIFATSSVQL